MVQQGKTKGQRMLNTLKKYCEIDPKSDYRPTLLGHINIDRINEIHDSWERGLEKQAKKFVEEMEEKYGKKKT